MLEKRSDRQANKRGLDTRVIVNFRVDVAAVLAVALAAANCGGMHNTAPDRSERVNRNVGVDTARAE